MEDQKMPPLDATAALSRHAASVPVVTQSDADAAARIHAACSLVPPSEGRRSSRRPAEEGGPPKFKRAGWAALDEPAPKEPDEAEKKKRQSGKRKPTSAAAAAEAAADASAAASAAEDEEDGKAKKRPRTLFPEDAAAGSSGAGVAAAAAAAAVNDGAAAAATPQPKGARAASKAKAAFARSGGSSSSSSVLTSGGGSSGGSSGASSTGAPRASGTGRVPSTAKVTFAPLRLGAIDEEDGPSAVDGDGEAADAMVVDEEGAEDGGGGDNGGEDGGEDGGGGGGGGGGKEEGGTKGSGPKKKRNRVKRADEGDMHELKPRHLKGKRRDESYARSLANLELSRARARDAAAAAHDSGGADAAEEEESPEAMLHERYARLLRPKLRRWCLYEWFCSPVDYAWFHEHAFAKMLRASGLGHVTKLTRFEWSFVRALYGRPRRLSKPFLDAERARLHEYRQDVRQLRKLQTSGHAAAAAAEAALGLQGCVVQMAVGQRVTAFHPKERHLFSGTVLTPDGDHYRVQFDRPKLGVQHVKDWLLLPLLDGSRGIDFTSPHGQLGQPLGQQNPHGAHDGAAPAPAPAPAPAAPPGRQSWEADAKGAERGAERSGAPLAAAPVGAVSSAPDAPGSSQPLAAAPLVGASESTAPAAGPVGGIASVVRSDLKELQLLAYAMRLLERKRLLLDELKAVTHQGEKELIRVAHQIERAVAEGRAVLIVSEDDIAPERSIAEGRRAPIRVEVTAAQQRLLGQVPSPMTLPAVGALLTQLRAQHGADEARQLEVQIARWCGEIEWLTDELRSTARALDTALIALRPVAQRFSLALGAAAPEPQTHGMGLAFCAGLREHAADAAAAVVASILCAASDSAGEATSERTGMVSSDAPVQASLQLRLQLRLQLPPKTLRDSITSAISLLLQLHAWSTAPISPAECRAGLLAAVKQLAPICETNRPQFNEVVAAAQQLQALVCGQVAGLPKGAGLRR